MPFTTGVDGARLYYEESGAGVPMVFVHGFTLDHRMWLGQRDYFAKDYRVILHDMRGHGKSDAPQSNYSRGDRADDLKLMLDQLGIDKCHLVGLSMGGSTGIGFALEHQERLLSLTLVSTGAAGWSVGKKFKKVDNLAKAEGYKAALDLWMDWALTWYRGKPEYAQITRQMEEMVREHSGAYWTDPKRGTYVTPPDLENVHKIKVPTLIMIGELDRVFVPLAEQLNQKIAGSMLVKYPGVGHMINMEIPEKFNKELGKWVKRLER
jgi:3-oxoadipate enol-lactonase